MRLLRPLLALFLAILAATPATALDKVTLATNWKAEAEHGGFYQAIATGIYRRHGLDVTLRMGGPQVNNPQLLAAGQVDFNVGASSFAALNYVKAGVPVATVAAIFQKDPQVLIAHPGQGNDSLEALKGKPILIAPSARATFWNFLRIRYGYTDDQIRTYTFNMTPFLVDKKTIQEGYLTSEPYTLEKAGVKPVVHVSRTMALTAIRRRSNVTGNWFRPAPTSCSGSSTRASRGGTATCTAIPRRPTR